MDKTSLKQKLLLVIFGLFLTLILLEVGLRIAGAFVLYLQEQHNHLSFNKNEYRILCLGESTTALGGEDAYPRQLEVMLNAQGRQRKFTVINKGIISTTSNYILTHIDQNLDTYKPKMVIVMMGINDRAYLHGPNKSLWWENIKSFLKDFRVYKLAHLLYEHISHRLKEINTSSNTVDLSHPDDANKPQMENFLKLVIADSMRQYREHIARKEEQFAKQSLMQTSMACIELARRYRLKGDLQDAQNILRQATVLDPKDAMIYEEWGEFFLAQTDASQAIKYFQVALDLDPQNSDAMLGLAKSFHQERNDNAFLVYARYLQIKPQDYWGYTQLAQWLIENKHDDLAQGYLSHAMALGPDFDQAYLEMGQTLDDQGQYDQEEAFYLKEISLHPRIAPRLYQTLGNLYQRQGKDDLAKEYFQKAAKQEAAGYYPATFVNYALLLNKILDRNIKVVVMQYPLRDIGPLKDYLGQRNGVIYVENKQNFKQALSNQGYNYYFKDNFAYDFGHCTREGNKLIAQNLAEVILAKK